MIDVQKLVASEKRREAYRKEYGQRPEVKARQLAYHSKRNKQLKLVRQMIAGEITKEVCEQKVSELQASYEAKK